MPAPHAFLRRDGRRRWLVYEDGDRRVEVPVLGPDARLSYFAVRKAGLDLETVIDALWALRDEASLATLAVEYRVGDPHETFVVRPRAGS